MADSGTYDQATILRRQKIAEAMLGDAMKPRKIEHWAQGLAQMGQAGIAGYLSNQANEESKAAKAADTAALAALLTGGGAPASPAAPAANPVVTAMSGGPDYSKAISAIESGGSYDKLGPVTRTGDRAYGKYQVMGNNIPEWSKAATGTAMTPEQFLRSPEAQEAIFKNRFGGYVDKYGPEGAAKAWFAGEKGMNNPNAKDMLGTTVEGYGKKFMAGLEGPQAPVAQAMTPPQMPAAQPQGGGLLANATPQQKAVIAAGLNASEGSPARAIAMSMMTQLMKPQGYERLNDSTLYDPRTGKTLSIPDAEKSIPLGKDQRLVKDGKVIIDQQPDKAVKITLGNGQEVTAIQNPDGSFRLPDVKGAANMAPKLSEGERDQIIKDEDTKAAGESALSAIREARKLNEKAFSGAGAGARAWVARNSPVDLGTISGGLSKEGGKATTQLDNLLTEQALGSMKAIFGGNPTEGERKVLLDLQASSSKSPEERKEILDRAEKLMMRRIKMSGERAKSIREGSYFKPGGGGVDVPAADALKQKYGLD